MGRHWIPAPISPISAVDSRMWTWWPASSMEMAAPRPPRPAPTMITFDVHHQLLTFAQRPGWLDATHMQCTRRLPLLLPHDLRSAWRHHVTSSKLSRRQMGTKSNCPQSAPSISGLRCDLPLSLYPVAARRPVDHKMCDSHQQVGCNRLNAAQ